MTTDGLSRLRKAARKHAETGSWSQRAMAQYLGRNQTHLNLVLTGKRSSRMLLEKILSLPPRQAVPKKSLYGKTS